MLLTQVSTLLLNKEKHILMTLLQYTTVSKQLEQLHRLASVHITGAKRTAPTAALEIITGIVPLAVHIKREAMAACFCLKANFQ